jgi:hypothetical protein
MFWSPNQRKGHKQASLRGKNPGSSASGRLLTKREPGVNELRWSLRPIDEARLGMQEHQEWFLSRAGTTSHSTAPHSTYPDIPPLIATDLW